MPRDRGTARRRVIVLITAPSAEALAKAGPVGPVSRTR